MDATSARHANRNAGAARSMISAATPTRRWPESSAEHDQARKARGTNDQAPPGEWRETMTGHVVKKPADDEERRHEGRDEPDDDQLDVVRRENFVVFQEVI